MPKKQFIADKNKTITINDVALRAGVSHGTVSNVLNGKPSVSSEKIKCVEAAIKELGYKQNASARNLKLSKTGNDIYLLMPGVGVPEYAEIYRTIIRIAEKKKYHVNLYLTDELQYKEQSVFDRATAFNVDGILLITCFPKQKKHLKKYLRSGGKVVCIGRDVDEEECDFVGLDIRNELIDDIKSRVIDGSSKIAMFTGPQEYQLDSVCIDSYFNALFMSGITIENDFLSTTNYDKESAMHQAIKLFGKCVPDVIYTTSEVLSQGVRKAVELCAMQESDRPLIITLTAQSWEWVKTPWEDRIILPYNVVSERAFELLEQKIHGDESASGQKLLVKADSDNSIINDVSISKAKGTVRVLLPDNHAGRAIKYLRKDFENKTGIELEINLIDDREIRRTIKENSYDADVFVVDVPWVNELVNSGHLEKLGDHINDISLIRDFINQEIFNSYSVYDGEVWTLPFSFTTQLLFYRKDMFENPKNKRMYYEWYKEELQVPRTWAEYNRTARFFTRKFNSDSATEYGTTLGGKMPTGAVSEFLPRLWSQGTELLDSQSLQVNKAQTLEALQNYIECYLYAHPDSPKRWWDDEALDFASGGSAMMVEFSDQVTILRDRNISKVDGKVGFDLIPGGVSLFGGWAIAMSSASCCKEQACEFIKWTISKELALPNAVLGRIVPYNYIRENSELLTYNPWHEAVFEAFHNTKKRPELILDKGIYISENEIEKIVGRAIGKTIVKQYTPEQAVGEIANSIDQLIGK